jgi:hypothetical protein
MIICEDCWVILTKDNCSDLHDFERLGMDFGLCNSCFEKRPPWEPECKICNCKLVQTKDLWSFYCPIDSSHPRLRLNHP